MGQAQDEEARWRDRLRAQLESWASALKPPGLVTNEMSDTWERYYD
jgi:hypothetical protein